MSTPPIIAHVPMALSVQSSTLITVASQLGDAYSARGGDSMAVLSDNRDARIPQMRQLFVDYTRNCPREWFTRRELAVDIAAGAVGRLRPFYGKLYDPAIEALEGHPADIVFLYEGHYASATLPRWKRTRERAQVCLYVHNPLSRTYGRKELRRLIDSSDRVVFCAEHLLLDTERRLGRTNAILEVVHNGVEDAFFAKGPRTPPDEFTVVFAGKLAEHKGVHVLLEAVSQLETRTGMPPLRLDIVGGSEYGVGAVSPYAEDLRRRATALSSPVEFMGWVARNELPAIFGAASAVCIPSLWNEGLPLVALEALAAGTPVACSDSAGLKEAVGEVGFVHPMGDSTTLANDLYALATDPVGWQQVSVSGVSRARGFTWAAAAEKLASL